MRGRRTGSAVSCALLIFAGSLFCGLCIAGPTPSCDIESGLRQVGGTVATFSCVGYDPRTGDLGVIVQSKFFAVGAVVPWAEAGVGAIATQAFANTTYGPEGLALLRKGHAPNEVISMLTGADSLAQRRQLGIVDARGRSATFTGDGCLDWAGGIAGEHFAVQGNILVAADVVDAMAAAFQETEGMLGDRLLAALEAGQSRGGDSRGMQSAALLIVREEGGYAGYNDRYCDLRVDDAVDPIAELRRIYTLWKPNALIHEGYRLVEEGDFETAYKRGAEAVALQPDQGDPRYHLACYYSRGGKREEAVRLLLEALDMSPELVEHAAGDPDLEPIRDDPRVVARLPAPEKSEP
jgi:uncharacterized Ntn-hydrolase superfamily protein